jgi:hypothetical protein
MAALASKTRSGNGREQIRTPSNRDPGIRISSCNNIETVILYTNPSRRQPSSAEAHYIGRKQLRHLMRKRRLQSDRRRVDSILAVVLTMPRLAALAIGYGFQSHESASGP